MQRPNTRCVFVVQADTSKDFSDAKRYGVLKAVFGRPRKPYDTRAMMARARRVLNDWQAGDYLLMVGDPTLCAICMSIVTEEFDKINVLTWDRDTFQYIKLEWDFDEELPDNNQV